jgi:hypothetical protein
MAIRDLIFAVEDAKRVEREAVEALRQRLVEAGRATLPAAFGDVYDELGPLLRFDLMEVQGDPRARGYEEGVKLSIPVAAEVLRMRPFKISVVVKVLGGDMFESTVTLYGYNSVRMGPENMGRFFAHQAEAFEDWVTDQVREWRGVIRAGNDDEEGVQWAFGRLMAVCPDRANEWDALLVEREGIRASWEERRRNQVEREALEAEAEALWRSTIRAYWEAKRAVDAENGVKLAALEAEFNRGYDCWKLTYGVVAEDEEGGDRFADRSVVYVASETPDEDGYWRVWKRGEIVRVRFFCPVSLEPCTLYPGDHIFDVFRRVNGVWVHRDDVDELAAQWNEIDWKSAPAVPAAPEILQISIVFNISEDEKCGAPRNDDEGPF